MLFKIYWLLGFIMLIYLSAADLTHHFQPHNMQNNSANIFLLYLQIQRGIIKNERGKCWDYSAGNVSSDMNFTLNQQNTWILERDGEGWVQMTSWIYIYVYIICSSVVHIFIQSCGSSCYCSILMWAWYQRCRSVEVNIYPSTITAMPYSCFLWLLCVGNAISKTKSWQYNIIKS